MNTDRVISWLIGLAIFGSIIAEGRHPVIMVIGSLAFILIGYYTTMEIVDGQETGA